MTKLTIPDDNPNAQAYIDALANNEYPKCTRRLGNSEGSYCLMGVAIKVFNKFNPENKYKEKSSWSGNTLFYRDGTNDYSEYDIPQIVANWMGMKYEQSILKTLYLLNDNSAKTFPEIAKYLVDNYRDHFYTKEEREQNEPTDSKIKRRRRKGTMGGENI